MRKIIIAYLLIYCIAAGITSNIILAAEMTPGGIPNIPSPAQDEVLNNLLNKIEEKQNEIRTIKADILQRKIFSFMEKPLASSGVIYFSKPDKFLYEINSPSKSLLAMNGEKITFYLPESREATIIGLSMGKERLFRFFGINQSKEQVEKDYSIKLLSSGSNFFIIEMIPRDKLLSRNLSYIRIWIDKTAILPKQVHYREQNGDSTTVELRKLEINLSIPENIYSIKIPSGVKIRKRNE